MRTRKAKTTYLILLFVCLYACSGPMFCVKSQKSKSPELSSDGQTGRKKHTEQTIQAILDSSYTAACWCLAVVQGKLTQQSFALVFVLGSRFLASRKRTAFQKTKATSKN